MAEAQEAQIFDKKISQLDPKTVEQLKNALLVASIKDVGTYSLQMSELLDYIQELINTSTQEQENKIVELSSTIEELQNTIQGLQQTNSEMSQDIQTMKGNIEDLISRVEALE